MNKGFYEIVTNIFFRYADFFTPHLQGRVLQSYQAIKTVDVSSLQSGVYFVKVKLPNGNVETVKIVKQ